MEIDLNEPVAVDPLEVIINPVNPLVGFIELNDFIEEIEENIPQMEQNNPVEQNLVLGEQDVVQQFEAELPHAEGFPIPPLGDLIEEEVPLDQLIGHEEEGDDDIPLDQLVGPRKAGFAVLNNGGVQLPPNPDEEELMGLADELHDEQLTDQNNDIQNIEEQELGENAIENAAMNNNLPLPEDVLPEKFLHNNFNLFRWIGTYPF
jgi:hypothetical protein